MTPTILLFTYAAIVVVASMAGGLAPSVFRFRHRTLQFILSFVAGVMLGVGFFHLLPHAIMLRADAAASAGVGHDLLDPVMVWGVAGFLALFLLERFFHFHQHEEPGEFAAGAHQECDHDHRHGQRHTHGHGHGHGHRHERQRLKVAPVGWVGALFGLGIHSLLEGVALAASVIAGVSHGGTELQFAGFATFLVIVLHKPFDAMTLATLMRRAEMPLRLRVLANVLLALLVPAGIGLFWVGAGGGADVATIAVPALAFSAGMFLCIASSDVLPELQFHRHDRAGLSIALTVGLAFALVLARLEAASHTHTHLPGHDHSHQGHAH